MVLLAGALLAGCGNKADARENYRQIVDDYAVFTLEQDGDSAAYDKALEAVGIYDGLVRISAGIEDAEDLIEDLREALGVFGD